MKVVTLGVEADLIKCSTKLEVTQAQNFDHAISLLGEDTSAIICKTDSTDHTSWFETIRDISPHVSFIWFSPLHWSELCKNSFYSQKTLNHFVSTKDGINALCDALEEVLGIKKRIAGSNYIKISIDRVLQSNIIPCDVYLRLSKKKVVKTISDGVPYSTSMLERLKVKGVRYLYVEPTDDDRIKSFIYSQLKSSLKLARSSCHKERIEALSNSLDAAKNMLSSFGVDREVVDLLSEVNDDCLAIIGEAPPLKDFLLNFLESDSYIQGHSLVTSFIAGTIAYEMGWKSPLTLQKLGLAALLHDITLKNEEAIISDLNPESVMDFEWEMVNRIKNHAYESQQIINQLGEDYAIAGEIVLAHHNNESADTIGELSATFIIAEEFAKRVYGKEVTPPLVADVASYLEKNYDVGNFSEPLRRLIYILSKTFLQ